MTEFDLSNIDSKKDSLTGKVTFTESIQFKISMSVVCSAVITIFILDNLNYSLPEWTDFFFGAGMIIGYSFAFLALFFSHNAGKAGLSQDQISIHPKKSPEKFPDSPITLNASSKISINIIQSFRFGLIRTLLHLAVSNDDSESEFGIILKGRNEERQYLEVLESWYRAGYSVKEYNQIGTRVFKINQGTNYAEVQKIKQEYDVDW